MAPCCLASCSSVRRLERISSSGEEVCSGCLGALGFAVDPPSRLPSTFATWAAAPAIFEVPVAEVAAIPPYSTKVWLQAAEQRTTTRGPINDNILRMSVNLSAFLQTEFWKKLVLVSRTVARHQLRFHNSAEGFLGLRVLVSACCRISERQVPATAPLPELLPAAAYLLQSARKESPRSVRNPAGWASCGRSRSQRRAAHGCH